VNQPARRKRNRSRRRGGNAGNNADGSNSGNKSGGRSQQQKKNQQPKVEPREFWGEADELPEQIDGLTHSPDVRAVLTSLGRPPLTGNETAAEHWFSMVYERAAFLAGALAAAGDLDAAPPADD